MQGKYKKELKVRKLVLSKETLRNLSGEDLQDVVGGGIRTKITVCATCMHTGTDYTCSCAHVCMDC